MHLVQILNCSIYNLKFYLFLAGSPFRFYVHNPNSKHVTASGPGLTHGIAGETTEFKVHTKGCGVGGLKISIEGPSKAIIDSQDDGDNTVTVKYIPPVPGKLRRFEHISSACSKNKPLFNYSNR